MRSPFPLLVLVLTLGVARAEDEGVAAPVLELFTSHGCSSCPPADRLLGELVAARPALVALEFHVDYWNTLVHGLDGSFADPFSDPAWTLRQRHYDLLPLAGRGGVYTPQAIVDGRYATVGADRARVVGALGADASALPRPEIRVAHGDGVLRVSVARASASLAGKAPWPMPDVGEVALVRFLHSATTPITGGENRGLRLENHRIVTVVESLGRVDENGALDVRVPLPLGAGEGCAVLVRYGDDTVVLAGRLCPGAG